MNKSTSFQPVGGAVLSGILPRCFQPFLAVWSGQPDPAERIMERQRETAGSPCCGCSRCSRPLAFQFHYSGFWDFLQSCFGGMGPLSACQQRKRAANFSAALVDGYLLFVVCFNGKRLIHLLCCMLILLLIQPKSRL